MNIDKDIEVNKTYMLHLNSEEEIRKCNLELLEELDKKDKELETYKKIAEKLAEKADELDINCYCADILPKDWDCVKYKNCKDCIIDWARKEVENEI